MSEIKFRRDTAFRKQFFVPDSFSHPAKMDAQLLIWIVERYSSPGETILDPMAGSGTMMLACGLGRNCILVELEEKFCKMMRDNWEQVKMRPQLGSAMGTCQIIQGDARNLEGLLVDKIITSPPYSEQSDFRLSGGLKVVPSDLGVVAHKFGGKDNIGNLPYGNIDAVITSPPYEEAIGEKHHSPRADKLAKEKRNPVTYTDKVDSIITSPPYEDKVAVQDLEFYRQKCKRTRRNPQSPHAQGISEYSKSEANIGNLKSDSYLSAMLQVYQQCYKVLKSGGLMILVTKNFIRNKQVVRLDSDTIKLCEQAGFKYLERHYRRLPSQSFWRIIYSKKFPEVEQINHEDILVFNRQGVLGI